MRIAALLLAFTLTFTASACAAEVVLDLAGQEIGAGKSINVNSGLQRLPASSAYEFELEGSVRGTGLLATLIPQGTSFADLANSISPGATFPTSGIASNPGGKLPFGVIKRNFSGTFPVQSFSVDLSLKVRAGVAANGSVYFSLTGLDVQIPGLPALGTIRMESGTKLTIRSLFEQFAGVYVGHVSSTVFAIQNQGLAKLAVSPGGLITAQVQVGKKTYRIKTGLDETTGTPEIPLGKTGLRIRFSADEAAPGIFTVELLGQAGTLATVELSRGAHIDGPPTPRAGTYTALLHPPPLDEGQTPATHPAAPGSLKLSVTASGLVTWAGRLCDGTKIAGGSVVTEGFAIPIFASLSAGFGGIFGDLTLLAETEQDDLGGSLTWLKAAFPTEKVFALGVDTTLTVQGSRYLRPDLNQRALALAAGTVSLTDGNLPAAANINVIFSQSSKFIAPASLILTLKKGNGLLKGTYKVPGYPAVKIFGAILQKQNTAGGSFLGAPGGGIVEPGAMELLPAP